MSNQYDWKKYAIPEEPSDQQQDWKTYAEEVPEEEHPKTVLQNVGDFFSGLLRPVAKFTEGAGRSAHGLASVGANPLAYAIKQTLPPSSLDAGDKLAGEKIEHGLDQLYKTLDSPYLSEETRDFVDEVAMLAGEIAPLTVAGGGAAPLRLLGQAFLQATAGASAGKVAKTLGFEPKGQNAATIGAMILAGAYSPHKTDKLIKGLYRSAEALLPKGAQVNIPRQELNAWRNSLRQRMAKTVKSSDKPALALEQELYNQALDSNKGDVRNLIRFKEKINQERSSLWSKPELKPIEKSIKKEIDKVAKQTQDILAIYGKENPAWYEAFQTAEQTYGATAVGRKIAHVTQKWKAHGLSEKAVKGLSKGITKSVAPFAGTGAALWKSPAIRRLIVQEVAKGTPLDQIEKKYRINQEINA